MESLKPQLSVADSERVEQQLVEVHCQWQKLEETMETRKKGNLRGKMAELCQSILCSRIYRQSSIWVQVHMLLRAHDHDVPSDYSCNCAPQQCVVIASCISNKFIFHVTNAFCMWSVTEILVRQKFWSGGPKFLENWSAGPLFSENFGPRVELWSERKYFGVSTFNDTHLCQSVCIVSRFPRK